MSEQYLLLKWGTLKGWNVEGNDKARAALERLYAEPRSMSLMAQHDSPSQTDALCDLIDAMPDDAVIQSDWSGQQFTKESAKEYVRDYGKAKS